jgi:predicted transposase YdaD
MLGIELQQTRVYQEAKDEGRTDGERWLVLRQLTRKLGSISPEVQAQVNRLNVNRVEALGEDLLDFTQMSELTNWLERNG